MQNIEVIEHDSIRVLTTQQIADNYGTTRKKIQNNFAYNKRRYVPGKHYITLEKDELVKFKACHDIQGNLKYAHILYLWTEKGALLHAKSLNTDKAWEAYDYLVDFYFRAKEKEVHPVQIELPVITEASKTPVEELLLSGDERQIRYNRGVIMGVYKQELESKVNILDIYNMLSEHGKTLVTKLLFGEVRR